ncbi:DUF4914 family protein [Candidatus Woesearchaeota archaeon]|nr:DUF4914 family protein [Candidatus Woesearchaeota archaeon]
MVKSSKKIKWKNLLLSKELIELFSKAKSAEVIHERAKLQDLSVPCDKSQAYDVSYELPNGKTVREASVADVKNGISANYIEDYMRRRDPETMLIADDLPTDKQTYKKKFKKSFDGLRKDTLDWIRKQDLLIVPFIAGNDEYGVHSIAIVPKNAAFFAFGISLLQGSVDPAKIKDFEPRCFLYIAPPFRHTHFDGKQAVVHNRLKDNYEIFAYNLYPGPSAKKGIYGVLIHFGELENFLTNHCAVVEVITPYGNKISIMHEGASGGGKSEMNQHVQREWDGSIVLGRNKVTGEKRQMTLPRGCTINPVVDDMGSCYSQIQKDNGKIGVIDAESGWFIRVNHIENYGTDFDIESATIHPKQPLLFLNIDAQPGSTALLWEHTIDSNKKPCPNPRVVIPKEDFPQISTRHTYVDVRSFGIRTPPCTKKNPSYGVIGLFQVIPPAVAWLWRLVSPRGFANPSIIDTEGMSSEGVGSYWPFATGKKVVQANMLLKQIIDNPKVHYALCPVGNLGAWEVGFMPEWIMREYLSRRGGIRFMDSDLSESNSVLLGYSMNRLVIEGQTIPEHFLKPQLQPEVGNEAHKKGCRILEDYFKSELKQFLSPELDPLGKKIINLFMKGGKLQDFEKLIPGESIFIDE